MAYTLKLSNGQLLLSLPDQQSDNVTTSLTLIGKNVNAYGTDINQNYIRLLENFANSAAPTSPLTGQIWYDTVNKQIKVYTANNEFKPVGAPIISATLPGTLGVGDLWYDSTSEQLKFKKDATTLVTIGPNYDASAGVNGWIQQQYVDDTLTTNTVISLYNDDVQVAIASKKTFNMEPGTTSTFINRAVIGITPVWTATVQAIWNGTATSALSITDSYGTVISADNVLVSGDGIQTTGSIRLLSTFEPLQVGSQDDFLFWVQGAVPAAVANNTATMSVTGYEEDFELIVNGLQIDPAIHIDSANGVIGLWTKTPVSTVSLDPANPDVAVAVDINGTVVVRGDFIVLGASTTVETQNLIIRDNQLDLNVPETGAALPPNDAGIVIRDPVRNKEFKYYQTSPVGGTSTWSITENLELRDINAKLLIYGREAIGPNNPALPDGTFALGTDVISAPGLTSVGNLTTLDAGGINISSFNTGTITTATIGVTDPNTVIQIGDINTTFIDFAGKKLKNIAQPNIADGTSTFTASVATVQFVYDQIDLYQNQRAALQIDVTGQAVSADDPDLDTFVIAMLSYLYDPFALPPYNTPENSLASVLCTRYTTPIYTATSVYTDLGEPVSVDKDGAPSAVQVVGYTNFLVGQTPIPILPLGVNRVIKKYQLYGGVWQKYITTGTSNIVWSDGSW